MPIDQLTTYFFTQGVLGVIVIVMAIVVVLQDRRNRQDLKEKDIINAALRLEISTLQNQRVSDSNAYANNFIKTGETLTNQNKEAMTLIEGNQKAIEIVANILQSMKK